ncbi:Hypothetical protein FKW44_022824 [Caligus rogercresseyi]|uniref:Uncharacterized protein n=1 Tax=Caligus rogercresseyi TaxID=217165 RepID=A0A7T8GNY2_CALRO|nr:Hypothetical protein FKW44_022824 [Caligus rogercresseyi]
MQNELNTNKYFKLDYSANRCRCADKSGAGASSLSEFRLGEPSPVPSTPPSRENPPRKAQRTP